MSHILLIDDAPESALCIQAMLEALGHRVSTAGEGSQGLRLLHQDGSIELVLTDIMMPVLDGISLLGRLRQDRPLLPVVAMTSRQDSSYLHSALQLGARGGLFKPFTLEELAGQLEPVAQPQA